MYADAIVILSETEDGLKMLLDKLLHVEMRNCNCSIYQTLNMLGTPQFMQLYLD